MATKKKVKTEVSAFNISPALVPGKKRGKIATPLPAYYKKRIYIDLETTGSVPLIHGVHQIAGIVEIDGNGVFQFDYKVRPFSHREIDPEALLISNTDAREIQTYPPPVNVFEDLFKGLTTVSEAYYPYEKFKLIGYNVGFDIDFLQSFFLHNHCTGLGLLQDWKPVDVLALVRLCVDLGDKGLGRLGKHNLPTVANFFKVVFKPHDAMEDLMATRTIYPMLLLRLKKLLNGEQP